MSLQVRLAIEGNLEKFTKEVNEALTFAVRAAVEGYARRVQLSLRDDTRAALGTRVANAWRLNVYDNGGNLAALVYSKAPEIVTAFGADSTITAHDGHLYLAIPTNAVPRIGGHLMTPAEVELRFNQDLIVRPSHAGNALAFVNVIPARSGRGYRAPTKGRTAQGRQTQLVLMFVFVRQVHLRQRLNWRSIFADARSGFTDYLAETVNKALAEK